MPTSFPVFSLSCLALLASGACLAASVPAQAGDGAPAAPPASSAIRVNQAGFLPGARKQVVVDGPAGGRYSVVRESDGREVLSGVLCEPAPWTPAGRNAALATLEGLAEAGRYRVLVEGLSPSDPFPVAPDAYAGLADAALKAYYFNRAGLALDAAHAGRHARAAGHADTRVLVHASAASAARPEGTVVSAPGGWYDAGDYNKYVVNSGITMYTLLAAWEDFPAFFRNRDVGIPESGDAVPDLLDEAWWNLRWMLEMQDPGDGGVYHKLTNLQFGGAQMPEAADAPRYMVGKGTAAALDFAAVMAMAARVYAPFEDHFPGVPARMRASAERAWKWASAHPRVEFRNPPDVGTGGYGDAAFDDEFAWAAAELFLTTGEAAYLDAFERHAGEPRVPTWPHVGTLGWSSLARHPDRVPDAALRTRIATGLEALASRLEQQARESAWGVAMLRGDFVWGSNAQALNQGMMLVQGYRLSGKRAYLDAAQAQLDYVLGRNPLGVSFVTGQGQRSPQHIHHRPSQADGIDAPVPGWLSGGPNPRQQDAGDCPVPYPSNLPALSWLDHDCSYASNEVAINWNAPLVYIAAAIESLTPPVP